MTDDELLAYASDTPAKYATQDANGEWWLHDTIPYIIEEHAVWDSDGWQMLATRGKVPAGHDWRTTLREVAPMTTTPNAPTWPRHPAHKADELTRPQMIDRCNATLAFWPSHQEGARQTMPVNYPWRWAENAQNVVLMNLRTLSFITEADWCAGEDLSEPQCLHYGGECGENGYCAPCPNRPQPRYNPGDVAFTSDPINPSHYQAGKVECIDALESATVNKRGIEAVCAANVIKYLWRYESKGGLEDVRKARWYLELLENHLSD